ncbi:MAG: NAD(P)-binding domain-containing protein, partial [Proteobacteria bacterium]|nr:NAD(P)-binding domain-containing protein [Pseudomonadota bacterium]
MRKVFFEVHPVPAVSNRKDDIAIIGLGKTGTAIGYLLRRAGYPVVAVASRSQASLRNRIGYTGGTAFTADADAEAAALATCIFIT